MDVCSLRSDVAMDASGSEVQARRELNGEVPFDNDKRAGRRYGIASRTSGISGNGESMRPPALQSANAGTVRG